MKKQKRSQKGITLIALVITIIILLILAGVTISLTVGQNGILKNATDAVEENAKAAAREKLEITFGGAKIEKASNPAYNQDDYLDKIMTKEIKDIKILDNIVIVDGYAFEIDRSVPKVGRYVGKEEDLIIPNVTISEAELVNNDKQAKFTITAQEEKKGIKKIEVWLDGKKIDEHDENYSNVTTQITKECTVSKNGIYTVKVYGELTISKTVEVQGIVSSVSFEPNGDSTYKKQHTTKITLEGEAELVTSIKYAWIKDDGVNEPTEDKFTEKCPDDGIITGGNETMTGTYYLWVLLETETGKKNICASEAFNFDNEGPIVELTSTPTSETSFTLTATANDAYSEISKYDFYIGETLVNTQTITSLTATHTHNGTGMEKNRECYVMVTDALGNISEKISVLASTKLHTWEKWEATSSNAYIDATEEPYEEQVRYYDNEKSKACYSGYSFDASTGIFTMNGTPKTEYGFSINGKCVMSGDTVLRYEYSRSNDSGRVQWSLVTKHYAKENPDAIWTKKTKIGTVSSTSDSDYPIDRISIRILLCENNFTINRLLRPMFMYYYEID